MNMPTPLASSYCFVQVAQTINIGFLVSESVIYLFDLLLTICLRYKQHYPVSKLVSQFTRMASGYYDMSCNISREIR